MADDFAKIENSPEPNNFLEVRMKTLEEILPGLEQELKDANKKSRSVRRLRTVTAQSPLERRPMPSLLKSNSTKYPRTRCAVQVLRGHGQR